MEYKTLGSSSLKVSAACLGTMMMGSQTNKKDSKQLMSQASEAGINFYDTAEMYSTPPCPETQGNSEIFLGEWMKERGQRDKLIIASKVTGRCNMNWIRNDNNYSLTASELCLDENNVRHAVENSLRRLQTDYIDLYQIHWPDRPISKFGFSVEEGSLDDPNYTSIKATLLTLKDLIKEGKIRYIGISNENIKGTKRYCELAKENNLPKIISIQNAYGLVNREFEDRLAPYCKENNIGLLPYSILAMGHLTGKYLDWKTPAGSRKALFNNLERYQKLEDGKTVKAYQAIAQEAGITLNELAHAFVYRQDFIPSSIIGATKAEQLTENINACGIQLSGKTLQKINNLHQQTPNLCP